MNLKNLTTRQAGLLFGLVLLVTGLFYLPGVNGQWLHDDFGRIVQNPQVTIAPEELDLQALALATAHYPERPLPMMSFAAAHALCGDSPACQKVPNVFLHLLTGLALFVLLTTLSRQARARGLFDLPAWLPLAVSALWVAHPINVSTTLYAVQRMTVLATLFSLLALQAWLYARDADTLPRRVGGLLAVAAATAVGTLCKETALLVPLFIVLIELLLLTPARRARIPHPLLLGTGSALLFFALLALLVLLPPDFLLRSYVSREFTPVERLLTESRILVYYASEVLLPWGERMSIYLDIFPLSRSLLDPPTTLAAVLACIGAVAASLAVLLKRPSLPAFGILLFFTGHLLESTVYGLILAYEHRNYLPAIGLLLAACGWIAQLPQPARLKVAVAPLLLLALFIFSASELRSRASAWGSKEGFASLLEKPRWAHSALALGQLAQYYAALEEANPDDPLLRRVYNRQANNYYLLTAQATRQNFLPLAMLTARSATPEEREQAWQMLEDSASNAVPDNTATNAIAWLVTCTFNPLCPVDRDRLAGVIERLLANPRTHPGARTLIQRAAGAFYARVYGNPERGIALARAAAASGNLEARESLIKNLAILGRADEARAAYQELLRDTHIDEQRRARIEATLYSAGLTGP